MLARRLAYLCLALAYALLLAELARGGGGARNRIALPIRMASSALVWAAAILLWRAAPAGAERSRAGLAAAGMGCGFLGDLVMARVIPLPQHVMFGMLAFGAGHVQYLRAAAALPGRPEAPVAAAGLAGSWAVGAAGWRILAYSPSQPAPLNAAALVYALLLSSVAGLGAAMAARDWRKATLATGGALFLISDLVLAGELFRGLDFPQIGDVVWLTYLAGQGMIVIGLNEHR